MEKSQAANLAAENTTKQVEVESTQSAKLAEMESTHSAKLAAMESTHSAKLVEMESTHSAKLEELESKLKQQASEFEMKLTEQQLAASKQLNEQLSEAKQEVKKSGDGAEEDKEKKIDTLEWDLSKQKEKVYDLSDEVVELKKQLKEANAEINKLNPNKNLWFSMDDDIQLPVIDVTSGAKAEGVSMVITDKTQKPEVPAKMKVEASGLFRRQSTVNEEKKEEISFFDRMALENENKQINPEPVREESAGEGYTSSEEEDSDY